MQDDVILQVEDVSIVYHSTRGDVRATNNVSFDGEGLQQQTLLSRVSLVGSLACLDGPQQPTEPTKAMAPGNTVPPQLTAGALRTSTIHVATRRRTTIP